MSCCSLGGASAGSSTVLSVRFVRNGTPDPIRIVEAPKYRVGDELRLVGTFMWDSGGNPILLATGYAPHAADAAADSADVAK